MKKNKTDLTLLVEVMEKHYKPKPESESSVGEGQTEESLSSRTFEGTIELTEGIANAESENLCEKFGEILFHLVFYARIAEEVGDFDMQGIIYDAVDKMAERHPQTFKGTVYASEAEKKAALQRIKDQENIAENNQKKEISPFLSPLLKMDALPPIAQSLVMQEQLALLGFDWSTADEVFDKIAEEIDEVKVEINAENEGATFEEFGDLLFAVINLGRKLDLDPDKALRKANLKFYSRSEAMIASVGDIDVFTSLSPDEQDALWSKVKRVERSTEKLNK